MNNKSSLEGGSSSTFGNTSMEVVCEICGTFVDKLDYSRHVKTHKEKKVVTCTICAKPFTNLSNFKYHMSHHFDDRPWICDECPKTYKTKIDLLQHKRIHEKAKDPYTCEICFQQFSIRSRFNTHMKSHSTVEKGPRKCEICNKTYINLQSHIRDVHERNHSCPFCDKSFGKRSGLSRHIKTVHEKQRSWSCDICERLFGEKSHLVRHRKTHLREYQESLQKEETKSKKRVKNIKVEESDSSMSSSSREERSTLGPEMLYIKVEKKEEEEVEEQTCEYSCQECSVTFKQKRYYQSHMSKFHGKNKGKTLECKYCPEKFTHRTQRLRHTRQKHPEIYEEDSLPLEMTDEEMSNRICELCNKFFKTPKYLEIHLSTVHKAKLFECDFCMQKFSFKKSMERHIMAIHENKRDFKCEEPLCEKAFRSRYELNEHFKNIHAENENRTENCVVCDLCNKVCSSRKTLYSHKKLTHENVKWGTSFQCKICLETFDSRYKKSKHFQQVHKNGEQMDRICHYCSSHFTYFDDFKTHIESHENCFICITCGYSFPSDSSLYIHQESHKQIEEEFRPFICDNCGHRLSTKHLLEVHMRKHSSSNSYYVCDECGKSYKFQAPFLHHKLVHKNTFDHNCSYCEKSFRTNREKVLHERVHNGVRPYKCEVCEKTFSQKPNYVNHMKTHQDKYFDCMTCFITLSSKTQLRQHEINEHPEIFPYKCLECGRMFKSSHTFEDHIEKCE